MDIVEIHMNYYASECKKELDARLGQERYSELLCQIKKAMDIFSSMNYSCKEIYDFIDEKAEEYSHMIDNEMKDSQIC